MIVEVEVSSRKEFDEPEVQKALASVSLISIMFAYDQSFLFLHAVIVAKRVG